jgi:vacuolar-type H+-ATPase subunit H
VWAKQGAALKKRLTPADPTSTPLIPRSSDSPARQMQKVIADLEARIQFLEAQLQRAYEKPDLARFSSSELAIMASEAATNILQVAREENDALVSEAKKILENAKTQAQTRLDEAREETQALLADAHSKAANLQADVDRKSDELLSSARAEAETILTEAREEAGAMIFKAKTEEGEILKGALKRRDAMFDELELQRRTMISTLDDAAEIQRLFAEGYGHLRQALDESVANLIEPVKRARRQVNYLDSEIAERTES